MRVSGRPICAAPLEGIPSTVPLHDALFLYGEAVQSNEGFCGTSIHGRFCELREFFAIDASGTGND